MKRLVLTLFMLITACQGKVVEPRDELPSADGPVYENTLGLPIWPGVRLGGLNKEVGRPDSKESNLNRVIRIVSNNALIISGVMLVAAIVLGVGAGYSLPGCGHLAGLSAVLSVFFLGVGAFAEWIIYIAGVLTLCVVGYVVWLAVSADRRKKAVNQAKQAISQVEKSFKEVVQTVDLVKRAPAEHWDDEESALRKAVDSVQSEDTKARIARAKGKGPKNDTSKA